MKIPDDAALDALTSALIALFQAIEEHGSPEVKFAYKLMMMELGRQIAKRGPPPDRTGA